MFEALTRNESQLRALIEGSDTVLTAIQRERESFADIWQVFPTFLEESRLSYDRLARFARDTRPLVRELTPAIDDLGPTLDALGDLGPDLRRLYRDLDPLITASRRSLPATRQVLDGLRPVLGALGPWLQELNPILGWVGEHQHTVSDMFANLGGSTAARTASAVPGAPGHYLRQFGPAGAETRGDASHPAVLEPRQRLPQPDGDRRDRPSPRTRSRRRSTAATPAARRTTSPGSRRRPPATSRSRTRSRGRPSGSRTSAPGTTRSPEARGSGPADGDPGLGQPRLGVGDAVLAVVEDRRAQRGVGARLAARRRGARARPRRPRR